MILGIGIDIVAISRIKKIYQQFGDKFLKKIYAQNEIDIAKNLISQNKLNLLYQFLAKRFSAKEACSKAIGIGIGRGIDFNDISVVNDCLGKSSIIINENKIDFLKKHFACQNFSIHLSLSDEKTIATAMVIIEKCD